MGNMIYIVKDAKFLQEKILYVSDKISNANDYINYNGKPSQYIIEALPVDEPFNKLIKKWVFTLDINGNILYAKSYDNIICKILFSKKQIIDEVKGLTDIYEIHLDVDNYINGEKKCKELFNELLNNKNFTELGKYNKENNGFPLYNIKTNSIDKYETVIHF